MSVGGPALANDSITAEKIADLSVGAAALANDAVNSDKLAAYAVVTDSIVDDAVTGAKIENAVTIATSVTSPLIDGQNFKINGGQGSDGQVLTSTGSGVAWEDAPAGSGGSSGGSSGGGGTLLQTVYKSGKSFSRTNSNSWTASALYIEITPTDSSSIMLITFNTLAEAQGDGSAQANFTIYADGTRIDNSYYKRCEKNSSYEQTVITQTHTHGTTNQIQYKLYMQADPSGGSYAWAYAAPNRDYYDIVVQEIST